jgi:tripartite motif-containing protein 71
MFRSRHRFPRVLVGLLAAAILAALLTSPAGASFATPAWQRQIGRPGHAFVYPWGMATAIDGTILTSDYNNYRIRRFSPDGAWLQDISSLGSGPGQTNQPYGIAVDPNDGSIYLADVVNNEIDKFNAAGKWQFAIKPSAPDLGPYVYTPRLAVNSLGWVYVVSSHNLTPDWPHRVLVYDQAGTLMNEFGSNGTGDGQFNVMRGIGIGPGDEVFVADNGNRRIQVFDRDGHFLRKFGRGGSQPGQFGYDMRGIAVDKDNGWVYVSDASQGQVEKFDLQGQYVTTIGAPGQDPGQLGGPREVTVGLDHNLYVADYTYWRINVYAPDGTFLREIPNPAVPAPAGGFNQAEDVAVDPSSGAVYVSDTFNHRIQKFSSTGQFQMMWGFRGRNDPNAMDYPRGIAVDPATGNVWLDNTRSGNIKAYTSSSGFIGQFGSQGSALDQFFYARGIWVGADGRVLVPDSFNFRLKIMDQSGHNLVSPPPCGVYPPLGTTPPSLLGGCTGVTQDAAGNIYAAAPSEQVVYKFDSAGNLLTKFGTPNTAGTADGQFNQPYDVAVYGDRLYVSEVGNNRISVLGLDGTFIGKWGSGGKAHGQFLSPSGLAVDASGRIYVMDKGNERIEVFAP